MSSQVDELYELSPVDESALPNKQRNRRSPLRRCVQRHTKWGLSAARRSACTPIFNALRLSLPWISFLLALAFFVLTTIYAWHPELVSHLEVVGGSPAKALLLLAILSGITNPMLSATISHSFEILQWTLVARPQGHTFLDHLLLEPGTGIQGLLGVI
jgi:hypothetical protein